MGFESFGNVPTKESLQARLEDLKRQKESYSNRLTQAEDTPVSNLFSEGEKNSAINNHKTMVEQVNSEMEKIEKDLVQIN